MSRALRSKKNVKCRIESSENGTITISVPRATKAYKQGNKVIVITSKRRASAFRKHRKVSEIVAHGPITDVSEGKIVIASGQSPIVSKDAQTTAIVQKQPVIIKGIK